MDYLARELDVRPCLVGTLRRDPGWSDLGALLSLMRHLRRERPQIVHTHAAKAGTLGRLAALLIWPGRRRPILVHTYHGHSLTGYFSSRTATLYRNIERWLARRTDCLVAVSAEVRDELVDLGVAPPERFTVVPLGFDLSAFTLPEDERRQVRQALRRELGIAPDATVVTIVARLVPIKRVDRFLEMASGLRNLPALTFLIVGDGELGNDLRATASAQGLGERLVWAGFRLDMPAVFCASDLVVQTSDNEGTPVSLIEAHASGLPAVSTRVGGTPSVVLDGVSGRIVARDDPLALLAAVRGLVQDDALRSQMGGAGQKHVLAHFHLNRLVEDIDRLYRSLLNRRAEAVS
jgi:glycosyltransferase involved in cell wall biosynthesis